MRWKLVLLLGLLATGTVAAALVRAQEAAPRESALHGGGSLRSRPTPATPIDGASQFRPTSRGGLAERLQQVRQSVVEDYNTEGAEPGLLEPAPETTEAPSNENSSGFQPAGSGLPSVLKRGATAPDSAPQARTATLDASPTTGGASSFSNAAPRSTASQGAEALQPPTGARPLGSPPSGARPLGSPPPGAREVNEVAPSESSPTVADDEPATSLAPPTLEAQGVESLESDVPSSRRRVTSPAAVSPGTDNASGANASQGAVGPRIDTSHFRSASTTGKEVIVVGGGPQLRIEAFGPKAVVRGRPASYTLVVSNVGEASAREVQVHVESRQDVEFAVGQATHGAAQIHGSPTTGAALGWSISELPRGAKAELALTVATRDTRPFELAASWTCAPLGVKTQIEVLEPQLAMTLSGPKDIAFGETKIYTITLTNPGTGDVENVMLALAPLSSDQTVPPARSVGSLRAGERKEIPIQLTAREAGMLSIRAVATAEGGMRAEAAEQVMVRRAQLQLAVEGPPLKYAGTSAEYRVRIANVGNAPAEDLTVTVTLPDGVEYEPGSDGGTARTGGIAWQVGNLAPSDERTFAFTCVMNDEGEKRFAFQARGAGDLQAVAAVATNVEALADLKLVVNDPPGPIAVGKEVTYEVRVLNRGTKAAAGIEIDAYFSEGIEPSGVEGLPGELAPGQVTAAPVPSLAPGAEIVLKIKATAQQPGNHIFRAVVRCANPETRLATEETTRFFGNAQPAPIAQPSPADPPSLSEQPSPFQPRKR